MWRTGMPQALRRQFLQDLREGAPLLVVVVGEDLALGEMGEDPFDAQVGEGGDLADDAAGLRLHRPPPAHPRVHLDVDRRPDAGLSGPLLKLPGKREIGDRGGQGVFDDLVDLGIGGGREDDDGGRDPAHPELYSLVCVCHAEAGGAVEEGGVGDLDRPVAVGVRLDHLHDPHAGADEPFHLRPVRGEVAEIDLDPASVSKIFL